MIKVEITIVDGEWQWLGHLTEQNLDKLCAFADGLNASQEVEEEE